MFNKLRTPILVVITLTLMVTSMVLGYKIYLVKQAQSMNLILISVDTLRADHMGVYGYKRNTTPNIDKWAKNATVFTNAYTIFPLTLHSFYTLFTGRDDVLYDSPGIWDTVNNANSEKDLSFQTLPLMMKKMGHTTAAFVTNPVLGSLTNFFKIGFDKFVYTDKANPTNKLDYESFKKDYENSVETTNKAIEWLKNNSHKNKFFLWVHYTTPHMPYNPPLKYLCKFDPENCGSENYVPIASDGDPYGKLYESCSNKAINPLLIQRAINAYDAEISATDELVGQVLMEIQKQKLPKNTIIVFYGDHGESFDHGLFGHGNSLYNSSVHIPFIMQEPYHKKNKDNRLLSNLSINKIIDDIFYSRDSSRQKANYILMRVENFGENNNSKILKYGLVNTKYKYIYNNLSCSSENVPDEMYNFERDKKEKVNIKNSNNSVLLIREILQNRFSKNKIKFDNTNVYKEKMRSLGY